MAAYGLKALGLALPDNGNHPSGRNSRRKCSCPHVRECGSWKLVNEDLKMSIILTPKKPFENAIMVNAL